MFIRHDKLFFLNQRNKDNYLSIRIYGFLLVPNFITFNNLLSHYIKLFKMPLKKAFVWAISCKRVG